MGIYKHYITVDDHSRIISGWSDGVHPEYSTEGAILLRVSSERRFRLLPSLNINQPIVTEDGIPLYEWQDGAPAPRTLEDIDLDRSAIPADPPSKTTLLEHRQANAEAAIRSIMTVLAKFKIPGGNG